MALTLNITIVTAEAHYYDDLHRLDDQPKPDQVEHVHAMVHMLARPRAEAPG